MKRGFVEPANPLRRCSSARVAATRQQRDHRADQQHEREALTDAIATRKSTSAVIAVTTFASRIVWKPLP